MSYVHCNCNCNIVQVIKWWQTDLNLVHQSNARFCKKNSNSFHSLNSDWLLRFQLDTAEKKPCLLLHTWNMWEKERIAYLVINIYNIIIRNGSKGCVYSYCLYSCTIKYEKRKRMWENTELTNYSTLWCHTYVLSEIGVMFEMRTSIGIILR